MIKTATLLALMGSLLGVSGCAGYSNMVNAFAPPRQKSEVVLAAACPTGKTPWKSPFCPEPPIPPKLVSIQEIYMVMPEGGGKAGTVAVSFNDGKEVMLHGDYSAMSLAGDERRAYVGDQAQLEATFGSAIKALPKPPMSATLYFLLGKDVLTPASAADAEKVYAEFAARQVPEIWVIGHTDSVGKAPLNQTLSLKRAEKIRQSLIRLGVPAQSIQASGRGESELLVPTPDNTKEPKNRRVEISVR